MAAIDALRRATGNIGECYKSEEPIFFHEPEPRIIYGFEEESAPTVASLEELSLAMPSLSFGVDYEEVREPGSDPRYVKSLDVKISGGCAHYYDPDVTIEG
jgi:hypothetical protein